MLLEFFWPRGGWGRAAQYVRHRVQRLPGTPESIARGIWAGVFITFTPFYGLHFLTAGILAFLVRGNILAALMATFFGNPLTYVPIGVISMRAGYYLLDLGSPSFRDGEDSAGSIGRHFSDALEDLWHNFKSVFTLETADWTGLQAFYETIFFPWMIGGIIPGIVAGTVAYYLSVPLLRAYQKRRKKRALRRRLHDHVADNERRPDL